MTNQLTRVIMENIASKYKSNKKNDTHKMHIDNKEENMIKRIIHKGNNESFQMEVNKTIEDKSSTKYITLDELIGKNQHDKAENSSRNENIKYSNKNGIDKVSLDDIVTEVSLASIGKRR